MRDTNAALRIANGLLVLERGQDELLLANNIEPRPLYVKRGRRYIRDFLKTAGELGAYNRIIAAFPHEKGLLDVMLDYGIIVSAENALKNLQVEDSLQSQPSGHKKTISLYLLLSQSCNMRCVYCLDGTRTYQTDQNLRMSKEVAFKSTELCLEELDDRGRLEVIFFGGEPLLNWPLAKDVITHCGKCLREQHQGKQVQYHFTSNLSFLPNDLIEWAKKYPISFLGDIDGPPAVHDRCRPLRNGGGTYEATARNIQKMRAAGLRIDLRATITSWNQDHLLETTEHHKALGGNSSAFVPVVPVNSDEDILPESLLPSPDKVIGGMAEVFRSKLWKPGELFPFNQYASRLRPGLVTGVDCGAANGTVPTVDANGDVYPCIYLVGIKRFRMGNMMDGSYPRRDFMEQLYDQLRVDHLEDCKQCSWRYICRGSCPLGRLTVDHNPMASPQVKTYCRRIRCNYTQSILELLLWQMADETAAGCCEDPARVGKCV